MLRTVLLLDGSSAMSSNVDYLPSRLLALRPHVMTFVQLVLQSTPLASVGAIVVRDGIAHRICGVTNSFQEVAQQLEAKYFASTCSGPMTLENCLRVAAAELLGLQGSMSERRSIKLALRIVLVTGSVGVADGGDVTALFPLLQRNDITVDVVSLAGELHILSLLVRSTGGVFCCPMNYEHIRNVFRELARPRMSYQSEESVLVPIGFAQKIHIGGVSYLTCPQCGLPQLSVPTTCPICNLLLSSTIFSHTSFIALNHLLPPSTAVSFSGDCALCACPLLDTKGAECSACRRIRCSDCSAIVEALGICPTCIAA
jgi:transcription initiation factor TFIIH subunit 2